MSCDDPTQGECAEVLRDVWLFLDDEMDTERRATVQHHLDDCSPCLVEAGLDHKLKSLLHNKCGGDRAPDQLRRRLVEQLAVTVTSVRLQGVRAMSDGAAPSQD